MRPYDNPVSTGIRIVVSSKPGLVAHSRDLASVGAIKAERTFFVMTKLVPGHAISG